MYKEARPVAHRKQKLGEEKRLTTREEVEKLMAVKFISEAHYTRLVNAVMVKKASDKWRMSTDYTNLNKAFPKDSYPLPGIDRLVDGAVSHKILNFLDAYSGYNQISMHPRDKENISFITDEVNYFYEVMPFGLKNVGETY